MSEKKVFARSKTGQNKVLTLNNGSRKVYWETPPGGRTVMEVSRYEKPDHYSNVSLDDNLHRPPYHYHWRQEEYFEVTEGSFIFTVEGEDIIKTAPAATTIYPTTRHTFRPNPASPVPCEIRISAQLPPSTGAGGSVGLDERFFRNIYSYLDDCEAQGCAPSPPQMLLFLHSAEVSLASPWGPRWLSNWVNWAVGFVGGKVVGGMLLGLKDSYDEYYSPPEGKKDE